MSQGVSGREGFNKVISSAATSVAANTSDVVIMEKVAERCHSNFDWENKPKDCAAYQLNQLNNGCSRMVFSSIILAGAVLSTRNLM